MVWLVIRIYLGYKVLFLINTVQNSAMKCFLGSGKYTPTTDISDDMGWRPAYIKQLKRICKYWNRRINKEKCYINKLAFNRYKKMG